MNPESTAERGKGDSETTNAIEDANDRWQRTAVAAFYRAEARGFAPGGELDDWLAAERELDARNPAPAAPPAAAEAVTQPGRTQTRRSAAKGPPRNRRSESSTGRNIGGMA